MPGGCVGTNPARYHNDVTYILKRSRASFSEIMPFDTTRCRTDAVNTKRYPRREMQITHHRGMLVLLQPYDELSSVLWAECVVHLRGFSHGWKARWRWPHRHSPVEDTHGSGGRKQSYEINHMIHTLAALCRATSAKPRSTSQGATRPEAGSSPSSSSTSEDAALVSCEMVRFVPVKEVSLLVPRRWCEGSAY